MPDLRIAFLLFPQVTQLDLTGPAQVLSRLGGARLDLVWKSVDPVPTDAGFSIVPTATFADLPAADILCVPGGLGANGVIADDEALGWVRRVVESAQWVTSVCTGSLILGAAGYCAGIAPAAIGGRSSSCGCSAPSRCPNAPSSTAIG